MTVTTEITDTSRRIMLEALSLELQRVAELLAEEAEDTLTKGVVNIDLMNTARQVAQSVAAISELTGVRAERNSDRE